MLKREIQIPSFLELWCQMLKAAWKQAVMVWQITTSPLVTMNVICSAMVFLLRVFLLWAMGLFIVQAVAPAVTTLCICTFECQIRETG